VRAASSGAVTSIGLAAPAGSFATDTDAGGTSTGSIDHRGRDTDARIERLAAGCREPHRAACRH
jgi:hypothetical protein